MTTEINRYVHHFEDKINIESVRELIQVLSQYQKIDLFFTTEGGESVSTKVLLHYLNSRKSDIDLYFTDYLISSGVLVLMGFEGKKTLTDELDYIVIHNIDRLMLHNREQTVLTKALKLHLKETNKSLAKNLSRLGLTDKEVKAFSSGKDVLLLQKDFNRLNY